MLKRTCVVCGKSEKIGSDGERLRPFVEQYVENLGGGRWNPYKAHESCVGSDDMGTPQPLPITKSKWRVRRVGVARRSRR